MNHRFIYFPGPPELVDCLNHPTGQAPFFVIHVVTSAINRSDVDYGTAEKNPDSRV